MNKLFFSGTEPQLLNEKALKNLNKIFENDLIETKSTGEHIITLYTEYVRPNLFALIILLIVCLFLFIRYLIKKHDIKNDEKNNEENKEFDDEQNNENINDKVKIDKINKDDLTDIDKFTISSKNNDESDNRSRFTELNEEYNKAVKENLGNVSEQALKDIYKKKKDKFTFDELTRIIVEGS